VHIGVLQLWQPLLLSGELLDRQQLSYHQANQLHGKIESWARQVLECLVSLMKLQNRNKHL